MLLNIFCVLVGFIGMEGVAWFSHKYLMHGLLWFLHRDHHEHGEKGFFERNDSFFLIFATPAIILFWFGVQAGLDYRFWLGVGITLYGFTYLLVHDVFIHHRFKGWRRSDFFYFRALRKAHSMHHKHLGKEDGECFGMLWVPTRYFKEALKTSKLLNEPKQQEESSTT